MAAVVAAAVNFQQHRKFRLPEDGVTWIDRLEPASQPASKPRPAVVAFYVEPEGPGAKAGIKAGDVLRRIRPVSPTGSEPSPGTRIDSAIEVTQVLVGFGAWKKAEYVIERVDPRPEREVAPVEVQVLIGERVASNVLYYQYLVGAVYLFSGLFVYFRRGDADKAIHFYVLCLASFVLSTFHYTGKLNNFDKVIYIGNFLAGLLVPSLFFHFALTFPEPRPWLRRFSGIV